MSSVTSTLFYGPPGNNAGAEEHWVIDAISNPPELNYNFSIVPVEKCICDLREHNTIPSLDTWGFEMRNAPSSIDQKTLLAGDSSALASYRRESKMLLQHFTGAIDVIIFDATVRREDTRYRRPPGVQAAHRRVHVDQNPRSALARAVKHGGRARRFRRFQIINAWRPLLHRVVNYPLALCDFSSLDPSTDLVPTKLEFPAWLKDEENYSVRNHEGHRWYYWKSLSPDELILFKCHDSASRKLAQAYDGERDLSSLADIAGLSPHTAFIDPSAATTGSLRHSLEIRALLFYD